MNCPKCGSSTNPGEKFCRICGGELASQTTQTEQMNNQQVNPQQDPNQMQNNMNGAVMANQNMQQQQPMTPNQTFVNNQQINQVSPVVPVPQNFNNQQNMNPQQQMQPMNNNPQQFQMNNQQYNGALSQDDMLLHAYIGANADKIIQGGYSTPAAAIGPIYCLYRKEYSLGIPIFIAYIILFLLLPFGVVWIIIIIGDALIGWKFNEFYLKYCRNQVAKIKQQNQGMNPELLLLKCNKEGGTTKLAPGIAIGVAVGGFILLIVLIAFGIENKLVCESPEGNITIKYNLITLTEYTADGIIFNFEEQQALAETMYIDDYIEEFKEWFRTNTSGVCRIEEVEEEKPNNNSNSNAIGNKKLGTLNITIPSGWEASSNNRADWFYYSYSSNEEFCNFVVTNYENWKNLSARDWLIDDTSFYEAHEKSAIMSRNINNQNWETMTLTLRNIPEYYFVSENDGKIYKFTFKTWNYRGNPTYCSNVQNELVNSLSFN